MDYAYFSAKRLELISLIQVEEDKSPNTQCLRAELAHLNAQYAFDQALERLRLFEQAFPYHPDIVYPDGLKKDYARLLKTYSNTAEALWAAEDELAELKEPSK